jgi:putative tricarboxylic transport membrane protein
MRKSDLIGGGIFTALGIFIFVLTLQFPSLDGGHPGPSLFPRILALLFIIFGGTVLLQGWRGVGNGSEEAPPAEEIPISRNYSNPLFALILIGAYMVFSDWLGFMITSVLLLFLMMIKLRVTFFRSIVIAILVTLFINLMFAKILRVPLPPGILGW